MIRFVFTEDSRNPDHGDTNKLTSFTKKPDQPQGDGTSHEPIPDGNIKNTVVASKVYSEIKEDKPKNGDCVGGITDTGEVGDLEARARRYGEVETPLSEKVVQKPVDHPAGISGSVLESTCKTSQVLDGTLSKAMTEQCGVKCNLSANPEEMTAAINVTSDPHSKSHVDAPRNPSAGGSSNGARYCSKCFDEDADDNNLATKFCRTCDVPFCDSCFTCLHMKKKQKDHLVEDVDQRVWSNRKYSGDVDAGPQRLAQKSVQRRSPLNTRDFVLQETLAKTGEPLMQLEPGLFQFMRVVEDEGDAGMTVDKVINVQEEILRFCKVVNVNSCSFSDPSTIDFRDLDYSMVTVTGMFGETSALQKFLTKNLGVNSKVVSLLSTSGSELPSGVYGFLPNAESLFLFYWSKEISHNKYASSSIACQCIRYLQRLCHSIVLLFDPTSLDPKQLNRARHQQQASYADMKVLRVVDCEEDVNLLPGFLVQDPCSATKMPKQWTDLVFSSGKEGYVVCCPKAVPRPKASKSIANRKMTETDYKNTLAQRIQNYHVDLSAIVHDDKQLRPFLRLTFPEWYNVWILKEKNVRSINASRSADLAQLPTSVAEEHEGLCKLWRNGVLSLFWQLCETEESAIGMQKPLDGNNSQEAIEREPFLAESFKKMTHQITDAVFQLRKKGALADIVLEMDTKHDISSANKWLAEIFCREVKYHDVQQKTTTPAALKWVYNFLKKNGHRET